MQKLLIIADDFTGALDTGIRFTAMGYRTRVSADYDHRFSKEKEQGRILSVSSDSRPLSGEDAYTRVYALTKRALAAGYRHFYKKTDSGVRGNIGMELKAVMDACGQTVLSFIPAMPQADRITRGGIQYIDGVPVNQSVFGKDPFEPVKFADVADIIRSQTDLKVVKVPKDGYEQTDFDHADRTVLLFDAETQEDMTAIAQVLKRNGADRLMAGCAGFAGAYGTFLGPGKETMPKPRRTEGLLALSGSQNRITIEQEAYAESHGFTRIHLTHEQKLAGEACLNAEDPSGGGSWLDHLYDEIRGTDRFFLDTLDLPGQESLTSYAQRRGITKGDLREQVAQTLGCIAKDMIRRGLDYTISMTGGDTLMGFMKCTGVMELTPVCEIGRGAVLSVMDLGGKACQVISKSGGLGEVQIFEQMYEKVKAVSDR